MSEKHLQSAGPSRQPAAPPAPSAPIDKKRDAYRHFWWLIGAGWLGTNLAIRATPKGSEALGYAVMMSVWNLTGALSDLLGSRLFAHGGLSFPTLILLNAGTTALVLFAIPFLPRGLTDRRDGELIAPALASAPVATPPTAPLARAADG